MLRAMNCNSFSVNLSENLSWFSVALLNHWWWSIVMNWVVIDWLWFWAQMCNIACRSSVISSEISSESGVVLLLSNCAHVIKSSLFIMHWRFRSVSTHGTGMFLSNHISSSISDNLASIHLSSSLYYQSYVSKLSNLFL